MHIKDSNEMSNSLASATSAAAVKTAFPLAVSIGSFFGAIDMTFLVGAGTLLYLALQCAYLLWKWHKEAKAKAKQ